MFWNVLEVSSYQKWCVCVLEWKNMICGCGSSCWCKIWPIDEASSNWRPIAFWMVVTAQLRSLSLLNCNIPLQGRPDTGLPYDSYFQSLDSWNDGWLDFVHVVRFATWQWLNLADMIVSRHRCCEVLMSNCATLGAEAEASRSSSFFWRWLTPVVLRRCWDKPMFSALAQRLEFPGIST